MALVTIEVRQLEVLGPRVPPYEGGRGGGGVEVGGSAAVRDYCEGVLGEGMRGGFRSPLSSSSSIRTLGEIPLTTRKKEG